MKRYPNLFLVGAPKCGTTSMADYLRQHPDIFVPIQKEFWFFGKDIIKRNPSMSVEKYLSYFSDWKEEKFGLDASPLMLMSKEAALEIKKSSNHAKILIMLRNPIDMVHSWYDEKVYAGSEDQKTLENALALESARKNLKKLPKNYNAVQTYLYTEIGKYHKQVERYFNIFGRENVHVIIFDDFRGSPIKEYEKVEEFLSIDHFESIKITKSNANKRSILGKFGAYLNNSPPHWMGAISQPFMSREARWKLRQFAIKFTTVKVVRKKMNIETRQYLIGEFKKDVENLGKILGRDLSHWCDDSSARD